MQIIDPLPNSKLNISKYLSRHKIDVLENLHKEMKKKSTCDLSKCSCLNELVNLKEITRDREWFYGFDLETKKGSGVVVDNGHITNLLYSKLVDKKLYKDYMRDFKKQRHEWNYRAIVIKNRKAVNTEYDKLLYKELLPTLRQSQIEFTVISKFGSITKLRKEILKTLLEYEENEKNATEKKQIY